MDRLVDLYVDVLLGDATEEEFNEAVQSLDSEEVEDIRAQARLELWASGIVVIQQTHNQQSNRVREVETMKTKTFTYKGQMINYYNKVRQNKAIDFCVCGLSAEHGYYVSYTYAKNK